MEEAVQESKSLSIDFTEINKTGNIQLTQSGPDELLHFDGSLDWLTDGEELELAVVDAECDSIPEDINRLEILDQIGELTGPQVEDMTVSSLSLFPDHKDKSYIIGRSLVVKDRDSSLLADDSSDPQAGNIHACIAIGMRDDQDDNLMLILIIVLVVIALLLLIICICCCCCLKKQRRRDSKRRNSVVLPDSIDESVGGHSDTKIPLYDELSIPFIDASLPPTPKMGRSRDQLAILLGRGSHTSLTNAED